MLMNIDSVESQMEGRVAVLGGTLRGPMVVGQSVRLSRRGLVLMDGLIASVLVGGKVLDQGSAGDKVQCMVMGLKPDLVQVGDVLSALED